MHEEKRYNQFEKKKVRHLSISDAVDMLTISRNETCCVKRDYVRKLYDYFTFSPEDSNNSREASNIKIDYIREWEKLQGSYIGGKRPEDLCVCYLCGPEPKNDFNEFVSKGVLPQNIWAFELDSSVYTKAVQSYDTSSFPQPRIIKQNIESFIKETPKKFDIIYIDACGSVPSSQHALRCITNICKYQRLESPGIIISNFTEPDETQIEDYLELVSLYLFCKENAIYEVSDIDGITYQSFKKKVRNNFFEYYGDFISAVLRDIPAILVPLQRLSNNQYLNNLFQREGIKNKSNDQYLLEAEGHSLANFIMSVECMREHGKVNKKIEDFFKELDDFRALINGVKTILDIYEGGDFKKKEINKLKNLIESRSIYQFLDKVHMNMVYDIVINQLAYPYHNVMHKNKRFLYRAKKKRMYTDITIYDECRYIYEWLPAIDQLYSAFMNKSWQYVFRFALDGLVKQREAYNNEFFYQGSVVSYTVKDFPKIELSERVVIEE